MQKENPFGNSVCQIKIRWFAERSHNFLMELPIQLIFGVRWDLDKLQICAKGKPFLISIPCEKKSKKSKKLKHSKKSTKKWFDWAELWRVYVYLISSTSMQKENPFWNSTPCERKSKKCKKLKHSKKVPKNGLTKLTFGEYMFIWLVRHPCKRKTDFGILFAR